MYQPSAIPLMTSLTHNIDDGTASFLVVTNSSSHLQSLTPEKQVELIAYSNFISNAVNEMVIKPMCFDVIVGVEACRIHSSDGCACVSI